MGVEIGVRSRAATRQRVLKARQQGANHMGVASGVRSRAATRVLKARQRGAKHMGVASVARSPAVLQVLGARQQGAQHMGVASGARSLAVLRVLETQQAGVHLTWAWSDLLGIKSSLNPSSPLSVIASERLRLVSARRRGLLPGARVMPTHTYTTQAGRREIGRFSSIVQCSTKTVGAELHAAHLLLKIYFKRAAHGSPLLQQFCIWQ
jgi:hypothetical protein